MMKNEELGLIRQTQWVKLRSHQHLKWQHLAAKSIHSINLILADTVTGPSKSTFFWFLYLTFVNLLTSMIMLTFQGTESPKQRRLDLATLLAVLQHQLLFNPPRTCISTSTLWCDQALQCPIELVLCCCAHSDLQRNSMETHANQRKALKCLRWTLL